MRYLLAVVLSALLLGCGHSKVPYQPQIDAVNGQIIGVEALIRWQHPEQGMIPPGKFISVAERSGLIIPIGEWVLNEACRQAVLWSESYNIPSLVVAVNLCCIGATGLANSRKLRKLS